MADLQFLSWARRGFARGLPDQRATAGAAVTVQVRLGGGSGADAGELTFPMLGPADVLGLDPGQVVRTDPLDGRLDFETNRLASIEFKDPDLPWLVTPWAPRGDRLEPWLALVVLERGRDGDDRLRRATGRPLPFLEQVRVDDLPSLEHAWAWAHVQVSGATTRAEALANLGARPERALARLISPRRLQPGRAYLACVVPTFEVGRRTGLGLPVAEADLDLGRAGSTWQAWGRHSPEGRVDLPVYFSWVFGTGLGGDFESLVWDLQQAGERESAKPPEVDWRRMRVRGPAGWPEPKDPVAFEGALLPVGASAPRRPDLSDFERHLTAALGGSAPRPAGPADPELRLPPPLYGGWAAGRAQPPAIGDPRHWVTTLNLDPALRAVAGLGVRMVQDQQEALMAAAWRQVGEIERANQLLRQAQLSRSSGETLRRRQLEGMSPAQWLPMAAPLAGRLTGNDAAGNGSATAPGTGTGAGTLAVLVKNSRLGATPLEPQFRGLTRSPGPWARRFGAGAAWAPRLIERWNSGAIAPDRGRDCPGGTITVDAVTDAVPGAPRFCTMTPARLGESLIAGLGSSDQLEIGLRSLRSILRNLQAALPAGPEVVVDAVVRTASGVEKLERLGPRLVRGREEHWAEAAVWLGWILEGSEQVRAAVAAAAFPPGTDPAVIAEVRALPERVREALFFAITDPDERRRRYADLWMDLEMVRSQDGMPPCARSGPPPRSALDLARIAGTLMVRTDPALTIPARVRGRLDLGGRTFAFHGRPDGDPLEPVLAAPEFDLPMIWPLIELGVDFLFPGAAGVPPNSLWLLQTNRRFVEAYLAGLNHAMAAELLWREFPTDQRGTCFARFWDRSGSGRDAPDIRPMAEWTGQPLGGNGPAGESASPLVVLVRGDLLRRYPRALLVLQEAQWTVVDGQSRRGLGTKVLSPAFHGQLPPDLAFYGFPEVDADAVRGSANPSDRRPGWFLVFQEPLGELGFGLNETAPDRPQGTWRDLHWGAVPVESGHLVLAGLPQPVSPAAPEGAVFGTGSTAAQLAFILLQRPVRIAFHASDLL